MPTKYNLLLRVISLCLVGTFLSQEISFCAPGGLTAPVSQTPLEQVLADPSRFEAPLDFSTLKTVHKGSNGKLIIHIQDAHSNVSGQQNLASMLDVLMEKYGVSLVLSEGGSKDCSLTPVKAIAPASVWKKVAKSYLLQGKLSGEEYLNLISDRPMKIMGLEDLGLYVKSVQSYGELARKREDILAYLSRAEEAVEKLKNKQYPKDLLAYEKEKKAGDFDLNFKALLVLAKTKQIDLSEFPELGQLVGLTLEEKLIDFNLANLEQGALLEKLQEKGGGERLLEQFSKLSRSKNQKLSRLAYLENTFSIAKEKNAPVDIYPNLRAYEEYLKHFAALDLDATLTEMEKAEDKVYTSVLSGDAVTVHSLDRYLGLLRTAYRIQMTTKDFNQFQTDTPDFPTVSYLAFVNRKLADLGYFEDLVPYQGLFEQGKESLEGFYGSVEKRDFAFLANTESIMNAENQKAAVLITGGYHTDHLMKLLEDKGYSIAVLSPIVSSETIQAKYEKRLLAPFEDEKKTVTSVRGESGSSARNSGVRAFLLGLGLINEKGEIDASSLSAEERQAVKFLLEYSQHELDKLKVDAGADVRVAAPLPQVKKPAAKAPANTADRELLKASVGARLADRLRKSPRRAEVRSAGKPWTASQILSLAIAGGILAAMIALLATTRHDLFGDTQDGQKTPSADSVKPVQAAPAGARLSGRQARLASGHGEEGWSSVIRMPMSPRRLASQGEEESPSNVIQLPMSPGQKALMDWLGKLFQAMRDSDKVEKREKFKVIKGGKPESSTRDEGQGARLAESKSYFHGTDTLNALIAILSSEGAFSQGMLTTDRGMADWYAVSSFGTSRSNVTEKNRKLSLLASLIDESLSLDDLSAADIQEELEKGFVFDFTLSGKEVNDNLKYFSGSTSELLSGKNIPFTSLNEPTKEKVKETVQRAIDKILTKNFRLTMEQKLSIKKAVLEKARMNLGLQAGARLAGSDIFEINVDGPMFINGVPAIDGSLAAKSSHDKAHVSLAIVLKKSPVLRWVADKTLGRVADESPENREARRKEEMITRRLEAEAIAGANPSESMLQLTQLALDKAGITRAQFEEALARMKSDGPLRFQQSSTGARLTGAKSINMDWAQVKKGMREWARDVFVKNNLLAWVRVTAVVGAVLAAGAFIYGTSYFWLVLSPLVYPAASIAQAWIIPNISRMVWQRRNIERYKVREHLERAGNTAEIIKDILSSDSLDALSEKWVEKGFIQKDEFALPEHFQEAVREGAVEADQIYALNGFRNFVASVWIAGRKEAETILASQPGFSPAEKHGLISRTVSTPDGDIHVVGLIHGPAGMLFDKDKVQGLLSEISEDGHQILWEDKLKGIYGRSEGEEMGDTKLITKDEWESFGNFNDVWYPVQLLVEFVMYKILHRYPNSYSDIPLVLDGESRDGRRSIYMADRALSSARESGGKKTPVLIVGLFHVDQIVQALEQGRKPEELVAGARLADQDSLVKVLSQGMEEFGYTPRLMRAALAEAYDKTTGYDNSFGFDSGTGKLQKILLEHDLEELIVKDLAKKIVIYSIGLGDDSLEPLEILENIYQKLLSSGQDPSEWKIRLVGLDATPSSFERANKILGYLDQKISSGIQKRDMDESYIADELRRIGISIGRQSRLPAVFLNVLEKLSHVKKADLKIEIVKADARYRQTLEAARRQTETKWGESLGATYIFERHVGYANDLAASFEYAMSHDFSSMLRAYLISINSLNALGEQNTRYIHEPSMLLGNWQRQDALFISSFPGVIGKSVKDILPDQVPADYPDGGIANRGTGINIITDFEKAKATRLVDYLKAVKGSVGHGARLAASLDISKLTVADINTVNKRKALARLIVPEIERRSEFNPKERGNVSSWAVALFFQELAAQMGIAWRYRDNPDSSPLGKKPSGPLYDRSKLTVLGVPIGSVTIDGEPDLNEYGMAKNIIFNIEMDDAMAERLLEKLAERAGQEQAGARLAHSLPDVTPADIRTAERRHALAMRLLPDMTSSIAVYSAIREVERRVGAPFDFSDGLNSVNLGVNTSEPDLTLMDIKIGTVRIAKRSSLNSRGVAEQVTETLEADLLPVLERLLEKLAGRIPPAVDAFFQQLLEQGLPTDLKPEEVHMALEAAQNMSVDYGSAFAFTNDNGQLSLVEKLLERRIRNILAEGGEKKLTFSHLGLGGDPIEILEFRHSASEVLKRVVGSGALSEWEINVLGLDATDGSIQNANIALGLLDRLTAKMRKNRFSQVPSIDRIGRMLKKSGYPEDYMRNLRDVIHTALLDSKNGRLDYRIHIMKADARNYEDLINIRQMAEKSWGVPLKDDIIFERHVSYMTELFRKSRPVSEKLLSHVLRSYAIYFNLVRAFSKNGSFYIQEPPYADDNNTFAVFHPIGTTLETGTGDFKLTSGIMGIDDSNQAASLKFADVWTSLLGQWASLKAETRGMTGVEKDRMMMTDVEKGLMNEAMAFIKKKSEADAGFSVSADDLAAALQVSEDHQNGRYPLSKALRMLVQIHQLDNSLDYQRDSGSGSVLPSAPLYRLPGAAAKNDRSADPAPWLEILKNEDFFKAGAEYDRMRELFIESLFPSFSQTEYRGDLIESKEPETLRTLASLFKVGYRPPSVEVRNLIIKQLTEGWSKHGMEAKQGNLSHLVAKVSMDTEAVSELRQNAEDLQKADIPADLLPFLLLDLAVHTRTRDPHDLYIDVELLLRHLPGAIKKYSGMSEKERSEQIVVGTTGSGEMIRMSRGLFWLAAVGSSIDPVLFPSKEDADYLHGWDDKSLVATRQELVGDLLKSGVSPEDLSRVLGELDSMKGRWGETSEPYNIRDDNRYIVKFMPHHLTDNPHAEYATDGNDFYESIKTDRESLQALTADKARSGARLAATSVPTIPPDAFNAMDAEKVGQLIRSFEGQIKDPSTPVGQAALKNQDPDSGLSLDEHSRFLSVLGKRARLRGPVVYAPFGGVDPYTPFATVPKAADVFAMGIENFGAPDDIVHFLENADPYSKTGELYYGFDSYRDLGQRMDSHGISGQGPMAIARIVSFLKAHIEGVYFFEVDEEGGLKFLKSGDASGKNAVIQFIDPKTGAKKRYWYIQDNALVETRFTKFVERLKFQTLFLKAAPTEAFGNKFAVTKALLPAKNNNARVIMDKKISESGWSMANDASSQPIWQRSRVSSAKSIRLGYDQMFGYSDEGYNVFYGPASALIGPDTPASEAVSAMPARSSGARLAGSKALLDEYNKKSARLQEVYAELEDMIDRDQHLYRVARYKALSAERDALQKRLERLRELLIARGITPSGARLATEASVAGFVSLIQNFSERPTVEKIMDFVRTQGISEEDIPALAAQAAKLLGYKPVQMADTLAEAKTITPYLIKIAKQIREKALQSPGAKVVFLARDGELLYDVYRLLYGADASDVVLLPASKPLWRKISENISLSRKDVSAQRAKRFLASYGITAGQKIIFVDTGFIGNVPKWIEQTRSALSGQKTESETLLVSKVIGDAQEMRLPNAREEFDAFRSGMPKTSKYSRGYEPRALNYLLAVSLQLMPRFHGTYTSLIERDGKVIAIPDYEGTAANVDNTKSVNQSIVNPVAAIAVQMMIAMSVQSLGARLAQGDSASPENILASLRQIVDAMFQESHIGKDEAAKSAAVYQANIDLFQEGLLRALENAHDEKANEGDKGYEDVYMAAQREILELMQQARKLSDDLPAAEKGAQAILVAMRVILITAIHRTEQGIQDMRNAAPSGARLAADVRLRIQPTDFSATDAPNGKNWPDGLRIERKNIADISAHFGFKGVLANLGSGLFQLGDLVLPVINVDSFIHEQRDLRGNNRFLEADFMDSNFPQQLAPAANGRPVNTLFYNSMIYFKNGGLYSSDEKVKDASLLRGFDLASEGGYFVIVQYSNDGADTKQDPSAVKYLNTALEILNRDRADHIAKAHRILTEDGQLVGLAVQKTSSVAVPGPEKEEITPDNWAKNEPAIRLAAKEIHGNLTPLLDILDSLLPDQFEKYEPANLTRASDLAATLSKAVYGIRNASYTSAGSKVIAYTLSYGEPAKESNLAGELAPLALYSDTDTRLSEEEYQAIRRNITRASQIMKRLEGYSRSDLSTKPISVIDPFKTERLLVDLAAPSGARLAQDVTRRDLFGQAAAFGAVVAAGQLASCSPPSGTPTRAPSAAEPSAPARLRYVKWVESRATRDFFNSIRGTFEGFESGAPSQMTADEAIARYEAFYNSLNGLLSDEFKVRTVAWDARSVDQLFNNMRDQMSSLGILPLYDGELNFTLPDRPRVPEVLRFRHLSPAELLLSGETSRNEVPVIASATGDPRFGNPDDLGLALEETAVVLLPNIMRSVDTMREESGQLLGPTMFTQQGPSQADWQNFEDAITTRSENDRNSLLAATTFSYARLLVMKRTDEERRADMIDASGVHERQHVDDYLAGRMPLLLPRQKEERARLKALASNPWFSLEQISNGLSNDSASAVDWVLAQRGIASNLISEVLLAPGSYGIEVDPSLSRRRQELMVIAQLDKLAGPQIVPLVRRIAERMGHGDLVLGARLADNNPYIFSQYVDRDMSSIKRFYENLPFLDKLNKEEGGPHEVLLIGVGLGVAALEMALMFPNLKILAVNKEEGLMDLDKALETLQKSGRPITIPWLQKRNPDGSLVAKKDDDRIVNAKKRIQPVTLDIENDAARSAVLGDKKFKLVMFEPFVQPYLEEKVKVIEDMFNERVALGGTYAFLSTHISVEEAALGEKVTGPDLANILPAASKVINDSFNGVAQRRSGLDGGQVFERTSEAPVRIPLKKVQVVSIPLEGLELMGVPPTIAVRYQKTAGARLADNSELAKELSVGMEEFRITADQIEKALELIQKGKTNYDVPYAFGTQVGEVQERLIAEDLLGQVREIIAQGREKRLVLTAVGVGELPFEILSLRKMAYQALLDAGETGAGWKIRIIGVDATPSALEKAKKTMEVIQNIESGGDASLEELPKSNFFDPGELVKAVNAMLAVTARARKVDSRIEIIQADARSLDSLAAARKTLQTLWGEPLDSNYIFERHVSYATRAAEDFKGFEHEKELGELLEAYLDSKNSLVAFGRANVRYIQEPSVQLGKAESLPRALFSGSKGMGPAGSGMQVVDDFDAAKATRFVDYVKGIRDSILFGAQLAATADGSVTGGLTDGEKTVTVENWQEREPLIRKAATEVYERIRNTVEQIESHRAALLAAHTPLGKRRSIEALSKLSWDLVAQLRHPAASPEETVVLNTLKNGAPVAEYDLVDAATVITTMAQGSGPSLQKEDVTGVLMESLDNIVRISQWLKNYGEMGRPTLPIESNSLISRGEVYIPLNSPAAQGLLAGARLSAPRPEDASQNRGVASSKFPTDLARTREDIKPIKDLVALIVGKYQGQTVPLQVDAGLFAGLEILPKENGIFRVRLVDPRAQSTQTPEILEFTDEEIGQARVRLSGSKSMSDQLPGLWQENQLARFAAADYAKMSQQAGQSLRAIYQALAGNQHWTMPLGADGQDIDVLRMQTEMLKAKLEGLNAENTFGIFVTFRFVDEEGKPVMGESDIIVKGFDQKQAEGQTAYLGALSQALIDKAKTSSAAYVPMERAHMDQKTNAVNEVHYFASEIGTLAAVIDKEGEIAKRTFGSLMQTSIGPDELRLLRQPHLYPNATPKVYEDKGLVIKGFATLSEILHQAYAALIATGSSA